MIWTVHCFASPQAARSMQPLWIRSPPLTPARIKKSNTASLWPFPKLAAAWMWPSGRFSPEGRCRGRRISEHRETSRWIDLRSLAHSNPWRRVLPHVVSQRSQQCDVRINRLADMRLQHFIPGDDCEHRWRPDPFPIVLQALILLVLPRLWPNFQSSNRGYLMVSPMNSC